MSSILFCHISLSVLWHRIFSLKTNGLLIYFHPVSNVLRLASLYQLPILKQILFTSDDETLEIPYPELNGESVEFLGSTAKATIAVSNYRLFIHLKDSFVNVRTLLDYLL